MGLSRRSLGKFAVGLVAAVTGAKALPEVAEASASSRAWAAGTPVVNVLTDIQPGWESSISQAYMNLGSRMASDMAVGMAQVAEGVGYPIESSQPLPPSTWFISDNGNVFLEDMHGETIPVNLTDQVMAYVEDGPTGMLVAGTEARDDDPLAQLFDLVGERVELTGDDLDAELIYGDVGGEVVSSEFIGVDGEIFLTLEDGILTDVRVVPSNGNAPYGVGFIG